MKDLRSPYEIERLDDPDVAYRDDMWADHVEFADQERADRLADHGDTFRQFATYGEPDWDLLRDTERGK